MTTGTATKRSAVKGTIAAAAGVVVLLGGAGSFALWNAQGDFGASSTGTGHLKATFGDTTWSDETPGHEKDTVDIGTFKLVPGDVLAGRTEITVDAVGDNLQLAASITDGDGTDLAAALPSGVSVHTRLVDAAGDPVTEVQTGESTVYAEVGLQYDVNADNTGMDQEIDLSGVQVDLQQVAPSAD